MARDVFVDTSGYYALLARRDPRHAQAARILDRASRKGRRFVTTDYVLDETATLLRSRGANHLAERFFQTIRESRACRIEWTGVARFELTERFFLKHLDRAWSFTDCLSFQVMKELGLRESLTTDQHFRKAGFVALLAP